MQNILAFIRFFTLKDNSNIFSCSERDGEVLCFFVMRKFNGTSTLIRPLVFALLQRRFASMDKAAGGNVDIPSGTHSVCRVSKLDIFARTRITNYARRFAASGTTAAVSGSAGGFFQVSPDSSGRFRADARLEVPADGSLSASGAVFTATGFAATEKDAVTACAMHAERILDEIGIPIFALPTMQIKHAEAARKEGRAAPMPGDPPRPVSDTVLPFPLVYDPSTESEKSPASNSPAGCGMRTFQKGSSKRFLMRLGSEPLSRGAGGQAEYRLAVVFNHGQDTAAMQNDDDDAVIEEADIEIISVGNENSSSEGHAKEHGRRTAGSRHVTSAATAKPLPLSTQSVRAVKSSHIGGIDESEGGRWALCETDQTFYSEPAALTIPCLFSPHSIKAARAFFLRNHAEGKVLDDCIEWSESEELTRIAVGEPPVLKKWYTCKVLVPGATRNAVGKATTKEFALLLLGMHFELLVDAACGPGLPLFDDPTEQAFHVDACRRYGRTVGSVVPPLPLKEWIKPSLRGSKSRLRTSRPSAEEIFVTVHRRIVSMYRQHLIEVDLDEDESQEYAEAKLLVRQYMVENGHPRELHFLSFMYGGDQLRVSLHIPVPTEFGIRGAYAIACSPRVAEGLCAMHCLDVLCTLGIPVLKDPGDNAAVLQRRMARGRIVPPLDGAPVLPSVRSPPGYREAAGAAARLVPSHHDVWNVMMTDAADFDIVEDSSAVFQLFGKEGDVVSIRRLFYAFLAHHGLGSEKMIREKMRHYCGSQRHGSRIVTAANNYWLDIPVREDLGRRVALGRCISRKGAERSCMIHALRIAHRLQLFPLKSSPGEGKGMDTIRVLWETFQKTFCKAAADPGDLALEGGHPILSPNPVMSQALALLTFRR